MTAPDRGEQGPSCTHVFPDGTRCTLSREVHEVPGMGHHVPATPDAGDASERLCYCGKRRDEDSPGCVYHQARAEDASTSASEPLSEDVEALAKVLADSARHIADAYDVARAVLASDWLAAREAKARAEAGEQALREAGAALRQAETEGLLFLDGPPFERVPWDAVARWLDDRAARTTREVTS